MKRLLILSIVALMTLSVSEVSAFDTDVGDRIEIVQDMDYSIDAIQVSVSNDTGVFNYESLETKNSYMYTPAYSKWYPVYNLVDECNDPYSIKPYRRTDHERIRNSKGLEDSYLTKMKARYKFNTFNWY